MSTINREFQKRKEDVILRIVFLSKGKLKRKNYRAVTIPLDYFDFKTKQIKYTYPLFKEITRDIAIFDQAIKNTLFELRFAKDVPVDYVANLFNEILKKELVLKKVNTDDGISLREFTNIISKELIAKNQIGLRNTYNTSINSFLKFAGENTTIQQIKFSLLLEYKNYLLTKGISINSTSLYISKLKAIYNQIVNRYDLDLKYPFKKGLIQNIPTPKRNLTIADLKKLYNLKKVTKKQKEVIDLYFLCLFMRGQDIADIITLKPSEYNDRVFFKRIKNINKNAPYLNIKIEPEAMLLINKYKSVSKKNPYILKYLSSDFLKPDGYKQYQNFNTRNTKRRKEVIKTHNLTFNYTFKTARHTWATIARQLNIPYDVIKACLGHKNTDVTDIYIEYNQKQLDEANRKVIDYIINHIKK